VRRQDPDQARTPATRALAAVIALGRHRRRCPTCRTALEAAHGLCTRSRELLHTVEVAVTRAEQA